MAWELQWSASASDRLLELVDWLAERSPQAAAQFLDHVDRDVAVLQDHPELGAVWHRHPGLGVRRLRSGKYWVYYEVVAGARTVLILTVRHAREDVPEPDAIRNG